VQHSRLVGNGGEHGVRRHTADGNRREALSARSAGALEIAVAQPFRAARRP
jgi:hypothetical protein